MRNQPPRTTRGRTLLASIGAHAALLGLLAWSHRTAPPITSPESWRDPLELELVFARPAPAPSTHAALTPAPAPAPLRREPSGTLAPAPHPNAPEPAPVPTTPDPVSPAVPPHASSPFLTWAPGDPAHPAAHAEPGAAVPSALQATGVLAAATDDTLRAAEHDTSIVHGSPSGTGGRVDAPTGGDADARARASTEAYLERASDDAHATQIAGSAPYYRALAHEARTAWRPPPVPEPNLAQALVGTFFSSEQTARDIAHRSAGSLADGRGRAALEALQFAHPNSDTPGLSNTMSARAAATARTTRVEVELIQDPDGSIRSLRVLSRSGVGGYDRAAMDAVRAAVARAARPGVLHGGWRSRWAFEVTMSRDPLISAFNGLPGAPSIGIAAELEFDEVTGEATLHYPGGLHRRSCVRVISSHTMLSPQVGAVAPRAR